MDKQRCGALHVIDSTGLRAATLLGILLVSEPVALAELAIEGQAILFYTDDVGIFSATRRLSRDGDPTQPAIDTSLTNKGTDVILEPQLNVADGFTTRYGTTTLDAQGQGLVYTDHSRYTHGTLRLQALHEFCPETRVRVRYYYAPNQFLGDNEERHSGARQTASETLTSHIWSARIEREVARGLEVRLLTRYGLRHYNQDFLERDTNFWTVGPHVEWKVLPRIKLGLSYHYERGLADGRNQPQFVDDVSYVNHYSSADVDIELMERLTLMAAFHYERNNWTSGIVGDERRGAHENVYQGEVILVRRVSEAFRVFAGIQHSNRKESFDADHVNNTNVGIGLNVMF